MTDPAISTLTQRASLGQPLLRVKNLSKTFAGTRALDRVSLEVHAAEIVAIVGQNGSGKSTLVKVLAGVHHADPGGSVEVLGPDDTMLTGRDAQNELHFIHQDLGLVPLLSTVENIVLGRPIDRGSLRPLRRRSEAREVAALIAEFGGRFDVTVPVQRLTAAERTIVAIARAMDGWQRPGHVLILDEPTAALHGDEVDKLLAAVRRVADRGAGVIFISHRLDEVTDLAARVVAMRDGCVVADVPVHTLDYAALAHLVIGRQLEEATKPHRPPAAAAALTVEGLISATIDELSFTVRAGEIVGVSGLLGSGREHLLGLLFGAQPRTAGRVHIDNGPPLPPDPTAAIKAGMAYVPADRRALGAVMPMTVRENLTLPALGSMRRPWGGFDRRREDDQTRLWIDKVELRPRDPNRVFSTLSGGNQQKVVLAKWLRTAPRVLLLDEPTQGVDIGAKAAIYGLISEAAALGCAVLVSSSDTRELVALCDRVLVLRDGTLAAELHGDDLTETALLERSVLPAAAGSAGQQAGHQAGQQAGQSAGHLVVGHG